MKKEKEDRIRQICKEVYKELNSKPTETKGVLENPKVNYDPRLLDPYQEEVNNHKKVDEIHLNENGSGYYVSPNVGSYFISGSPNSKIEVYEQLEEAKYKTDSLKPPIPISMEEYLDTKGLAPTFNGMSKYSDKLLLLDKLLDIRDIYRDGWEPDYTFYEEKSCIIFIENTVDEDWCSKVHEIFTFQDSETRNNFYHNFKKELEEVKELWN